MKLLPDKLGGSPKQMITLGVLAVLLVVAYFMNRNPSGEPVTPTAPRAAAPAVPAIAKMPMVARRGSSRVSKTGEDWHPTIKLPEGVDVTKIDPTIHFDLLAKLRQVPMETGTRGSVFGFGTAPPPPPPPAPKPGLTITPGTATAANGQSKGESGPPPPPPKPTAPPIPLKFYGYSTARSGGKRAFFLDGEDIDVANENDVIKNRYKIIRIGVNSVVVEDMNFKSQQTLPLVEELAG